MAAPETPLMNRIVSLCKRRGFIYPASEIYGGLNGFWDFGPLGTQLKNHLRDKWWRETVECPPLGPDGKPMSILGLDSTIIQHPTTWHASGHVGGFADLMSDCRETKLRYRADHVQIYPVEYEKDGKKKTINVGVLEGDDAEDLLAKKAKKLCQKDNGNTKSISWGKPVDLTKLTDQIANIYGPDAENPATLTEPRPFNLMFHSYVGVFQDEDSKVYLRPETAQGIFLQYKNIVDTCRVKIPFGVAQIGKAFRNEVTPRNYIFRVREFEQMEIEFFCTPEDGLMWYEFWVSLRMKWWESCGVKAENLFRHIIAPQDLAHYSKGTSDIEYKYPFTSPGFGELEGVAYRTDYDLTQHQQFSRQKMDYFDQEANRRYIPHVVEPSSGLTRGVLVLLCEAYQYDESRPSPEWLKIKPSLAPVKLGIFPLVNKDGMPEVAEKLYMDMRKEHMCQFDAKAAIGKRYARMDEIGTPYCVTIDGETLKDQTVTIRDRDTAQQERVSLDKVRAYINRKLASA